MGKSKMLVPTAEEDQVTRMLLVWLNSCPHRPERIRFEYLKDDITGLTLSTTQGAYKLKQYIDGSYLAALQFSIIYRDQPANDDERLHMDEALDMIADWAAEARTLELGTNKVFKRLNKDTRASLFARYDNGDEDHTVSLTLMYEVI